TAVRRTIVQSCGLTSVFEGVAKRLFGQGLAALAADESKLAGWAGIQGALQDRQNWDADDHFALALFGAQGRNTLSNVLATSPDGIAAAKAGIEQNIAPDSFLSADRPSLVVSNRIGVSPHWKAWALALLRVFDAFGRIGRDVLGFFRPLKQSAH